jgi:hypothetical protein
MMNNIWIAVVWVLGASLLGFGISAIFSNWLKLSRRVFLIPYVVFSSAFLFTFFRTFEVDLPMLIGENWIWGVVAGVLVGTFLVSNVHSQPFSRKVTGADFALNITWLGLVYGIIDALFLNVMPVVATWWGFSQLSWTDSWLGNVGVGILALLASLWVTVVYHFGYAEFRNKSIILVLFGNALITLTYLLSSNPLGTILSHMVMHIAAVFHGPETTIQLPPHRRRETA